MAHRNKIISATDEDSLAYISEAIAILYFLEDSINTLTVNVVCNQNGLTIEQSETNEFLIVLASMSAIKYEGGIITIKNSKILKDNIRKKFGFETKIHI